MRPFPRSRLLALEARTGLAFLPSEAVTGAGCGCASARTGAGAVAATAEPKTGTDSSTVGGMAVIVAVAVIFGVFTLGLLSFGGR